MYNKIGEYEIKEKIGRGSFATVYKGINKKNGIEVAIKVIKLEKLNVKLSENLESEIRIQKEITHKNIIKLMDIQKNGNEMYLVMEYCNKGDLGNLLREKKKFDEETVQYFVRQIASALRCLVENNFVHRDLKLQNILLNENEGTNVLKLGDFGFAKSMYPFEMAETLCGSPLYMAPEVLSYKRYNSKADLWSVGIIMYELLFGYPPFNAANHIQLLHEINKNDKIKIPERANERILSIECQNLIYSLLQRSPKNRITFEEFFRHPFLTTDLRSRNEKYYENYIERYNHIKESRSFTIKQVRNRIVPNTKYIPLSYDDKEDAMKRLVEWGREKDVLSADATRSDMKIIFFCDINIFGLISELYQTVQNLSRKDEMDEITKEIAIFSESLLIIIKTISSDCINSADDKEKDLFELKNNDFIIIQIYTIIAKHVKKYLISIETIHKIQEMDYSDHCINTLNVLIRLYLRVKNLLESFKRYDWKSVDSTSEIISVDYLAIRIASKLAHDAAIDELLGYFNSSRRLYLRSFALFQFIKSFDSAHQSLVNEFVSFIEERLAVLNV